MNIAKQRWACLLLLIVVFVIKAEGKVTLPAVFGNNMVLQQKMEANIWGKARPDADVEVTVGWSQRKYRARSSASGDFRLQVKTPVFGGPYKITISDGEMLTLNNVLIGDVWICSGQSNMEMPLAGWGEVINFRDEIAQANYPEIRLLHVAKVISVSPKDDITVENGGWRECSPETIGNFSSTAYFFAREVQLKTGIPIGLINTSWGGTVAEAWTSGAALSALPDFAAAVKQLQANAGIVREPYEKRMAQWLKTADENDKGYADGKAVWADPAKIGNWKDIKVPGAWENNGLPNFDGVVWFKKTVDIPAGLVGKALVLKLSVIDDNEVTWFNGVKVGETVGHTRQREYTIPANLVKAGQNTIVVRVFDSGGNGGIYGEPRDISIALPGELPVSLAGIWQFQPGVNFASLAPMPQPDNHPNQPTVLYNAMIHPLIRFGIKGAIWYQGESNADRAFQYQTLFPALITDWRKQWNQGDFPFYFVQLANFMAKEKQPGASAWAELREAQLKTGKLANTGMAVTLDIGDEKDIHPKNKQEVGRRLALIALANTYGKATVYTGPELKTYTIRGNQLVLEFATKDGLVLKSPNGFTIAGSDQVFYPAQAVISGNRITLTSPLVSQPAAARYGWSDNPDVGITNHTGLPASSFRTDTWKGITEK